MISPLNMTRPGSIEAPPVCGRLPAWHSRTSRGRDEPLPVWRTPQGFVAPGPHRLEWSGRRWDSAEGEYADRPMAPNGGTTLGSGSCTRLILAQNAWHDGGQIHFNQDSYYEFAPRPYYLSEPDIHQYLLDHGYSEAELTSPIEQWVLNEIMGNYADAIALSVGGFLTSRPFLWPAGDELMCQDHYNDLYGMPSPESYGAGLVHHEDEWPSAKDVEGFYAFRHMPGEMTLSDFDRRAILRRAWQGSSGSIYGSRYGSREEFILDLPPNVAFDIRIRKTVRLSKGKYRHISKESQAIYDVTAWRVSGAAPAALEALT